MTTMSQPIATPRELLDWVETLHDTTVPVHNFGEVTYHTIDLHILIKDLPEHPDIPTWWRGKRMTPHLSKTVALTILELNPPPNIRATMLFLMM
jgi:hypothetical protein